MTPDTPSTEGKIKHTADRFRLWRSRLMDRWIEVPHDCGDPVCPGDRNRRLLEAGERLAKACRMTRVPLECAIGDYAATNDGRASTAQAEALAAIDAALAAYQEAAKS